jgi:GNAT superfamily N-acetyltransferase
MRLENNTFDSAALPEIIALFAEEFPSSDKLLQPSYLKWLYECNPLGKARTVQVFENEVLIGFLAMVPVQLIASEEVREAFHVINVLVHPQHQGKKVFARMIESASELAASRNALLVGYPNSKSIGSWKRAGMQFHESLVPKMIFPSRKRAGFHAADVRDMTQLLEALNELDGKRTEEQRFRVRLFPEFVKWRYVNHPSKRYQIRIIQRKTTAVGLLVTERFYPGINLILDAVLAGDVEAECLSFLPWLSFLLEPAVLEQNSAGRSLQLPLKKQIPFFCTDFSRSLPIGVARKLGASVSDF